MQKNTPKNRKEIYKKKKLLHLGKYNFQILICILIGIFCVSFNVIAQNFPLSPRADALEKLAGIFERGLGAKFLLKGPKK